MNESITSIIENLILDNNEIRKDAENKIFYLMKNDLFNLAQSLFSIIQTPSNFPQSIINMSFIILRKIFCRATSAKQTNNPSLEYLLIPLDAAYNSISLLNAYLHNDQSQNSHFCICLIGQVIVYVLNFDSSCPAFLELIHNINSGILIIQNLNIISYILEEDKIENVEFQRQLMNNIIMWFNNDYFPIEGKYQLVNILNLFTPYLSNILLTESDNKSFVQMMTIITTIPELKEISYEFWYTLILNVPELFIYAENLPQIILSDLQSENKNEATMLQIFNLFQTLANQESIIPESTNNIIRSLTPNLLPYLLQISESANDTTIFPSDEEYNIFNASHDCITSLTATCPDISIPILINYGEKIFDIVLKNDCNNPDISKKETELFAIKTAIFQFDDNEENLELCQKCLQIALYLLDDTNYKIVAQSIEIIYNIIYLYPDIFDYKVILPKLIVFMKTPLSYQSQLLIVEIVKSSKLIDFVLLNQLLSICTFQSVNCIKEIMINGCTYTDYSNLHDKITELFSQISNIMTRLIPNDNIDTDLIVAEFFKILSFLIDITPSILSSDFNNIIQMFIDWYNNSIEHSSCWYSDVLRILGIASRISKNQALFSFTLKEVLKVLDNYIMNKSTIQHDYEDYNHQEVFNDEESVISSLNTIIFDFSVLDISSSFGEIMRLLLSIIGTNSSLQLKIKVLESINCLHKNFFTLMPPYLTRIIPLFHSSLIFCKKYLDEDSDEFQQCLIGELLKSSFLILHSIKLQNLQRTELVESILNQSFQLSFETMLWIDNLTLSSENTLYFLDLLDLLIQLQPIQTKIIISKSTKLLSFIEDYITDNYKTVSQNILTFIEQM